MGREAASNPKFSKRSHRVVVAYSLIVETSRLPECCSKMSVKQFRPCEIAALMFEIRTQSLELLTLHNVHDWRYECMIQLCDLFIYIRERTTRLPGC